MRHFLFTLFALVLALSGLQAQAPLGLHFLPETFQSSFTNPAFQQDAKFQWLFPSLGFGFSHSGFALRDIVRDPAGRPLFIDPDRLIDQLAPINYLTTQTVGLPFGAAFKIGKAQVGLHAGLYTTGFISYTQDLPALLWRGNASYIGDTMRLGPGLDLSVYSEIGLSFSYEIADWITVGGRYRHLNGLVNLSTDRQRADLYTDPEYYQLTLSTDYQVRGSGPGLPDFNTLNDLTSLDPSALLPQGLGRLFRNVGMVVDLGASIKPLDRLQVDLSVTNLGRINWNQNSRTYTAQGTIQFDGLDPFMGEIPRGDTAIVKAIERSIDNLADSLRGAIAFDSRSETYHTTMPLRYLLSARYQVVGPLVVGAAWSSNLFRGTMSQTFTGYAGLHVPKWVTFGTTFSYDTRFGQQIGLQGRLNLGPVQGYFLVDNVWSFFRPLGAQNAAFMAGANLTIGRSKAEKS